MPGPISSQPNGSSQQNHTMYASDNTHSQWLFTSAELLKSPSVLEGLSVAQELANRQKGVNFITQVGIMLKLPQLTLATASVFLHRFYMRYPMQVSKDKGIHHYQVAATALFLATKVEENCRKMKELIVACCRVAQKDPNSLIDEQSKEYWKWRDTILYHEDLLLEALCFDLQLEQPYRILFDNLCYYGVQEKKNLRNTSWAFLNDSHVTTMCLLYSPRTVAGSALYAGVKLAGITLPDDELGRPWWQHLELDILDIQSACNMMADVYENPMVPRQGQKDAYVKDEDILSFERTRRTRSPSFENSPAHSYGSTSQGLKREREDSWGHEEKDGFGNEGGPQQNSAKEQAQNSPKRQRTQSETQDTELGNHTTPRIPTLTTTSQPQEHTENGTQRTPSSTSSRIPPAATGHSAGAYNRGEEIISLSERMRSQLDRVDTAHDEGATQNGVRKPSQQPTYSRADEAEEVDYGSEEGEV